MLIICLLLSSYFRQGKKYMKSPYLDFLDKVVATENMLKTWLSYQFFKNFYLEKYLRFIYFSEIITIDQ